MDYEAVRRAFRKRFPHDRQEAALFRAPGRVNLIGEHTDYNGLPVLPVALQKEMVVAVTPRDDANVVMSDVHSHYPDREFVIGKNVAPALAGDWSNYCRAAVTGLWQEVSRRISRPAGMNVMVHGDIPVAAGLSSSSATVVACALAFLYVNRINVDDAGDGIARIELADLLARAEQYVGTRGGGMDQTVSLCARSGTALKIDFFPLRIEQVPLAEGYKFVVSNSMVRAEKSARQRELYNRGPKNCHAAAAILAKHFNRVSSRPILRLGDLNPENTGLDHDGIRQQTETVLSREAVELIPFVRHVISEGHRVERAVEALAKADMCAFGTYMLESHRSLRDDYKVSCPELDALVDVAMESGAIGSRLTGAGFGGCTVSLVHEGIVQEFVDALERRYYSSYLKRRCPELIDALNGPDEKIIICEPANGAGRIAT